MTEPVNTADPSETAQLPPPTLAQSEAEGEGRIGYGRYARYTPLGMGIVIVLIIGAVWWWRSDTGNSDNSSFTGKPVPNVTLTTFEGATVDLQDLKGSVVVINFWAQWCAPCKEEMPVFEDVFKQTMQTGEPVVFLGVDLKSDQIDQAQQFLSDLGITYITGHDAGGDDPLHGPIQAAFGIPDSYPTTLFIKPDGTVDTIRIGPMQETELRQRMKHAAA